LVADAANIISSSKYTNQFFTDSNLVTTQYHHPDDTILAKIIYGKKSVSDKTVYFYNVPK